MKLISLFSGIGGLEHPEITPFLVCEKDPVARNVLAERYPDVKFHDDIRTLRPSRADAVLGGWPCQDISVAGNRRGLRGDNSALFYELVRVAVEAKATSIVAENVPNLMRLDAGAVFGEVLAALHHAGFPYVSWRELNARHFGLPHQRRRVFIVASKSRDITRALHRPIPIAPATSTRRAKARVAGFYWTAGTRALNYSLGFAPTLKVGTSLSIPSPIAFHIENSVRRATGDESLALQGFLPGSVPPLEDRDALRLAGNAVARPVGEFVVGSLTTVPDEEPPVASFGALSIHGSSEPEGLFGYEHIPSTEAANLSDFVDPSASSPLGARAAAGLVNRLLRSDVHCPEDLWNILLTEAGDLKPPAATLARANNKRLSQPRGGSTPQQLFAI